MKKTQQKGSVIFHPCSSQIIGARHLVKTGRGIASPFVEVEVVGADYDSISKYKTGTKGAVRRAYPVHILLFCLL